MRRVARTGGLVALALLLGAASAPAGPDLRCASALCHSDPAMARLTAAYRACMAGEAAVRREPEALRVCAAKEAERQDQALLAAARKAPPPSDTEVAAIAAGMRADWLSMREQVCSAIGLDYQGAARAAVVQQCRAYLTAERTMYLEHLAVTGAPF